MTVRSWRWGCLRCGDAGPADSVAHALSLEHMHDAFACPRAPGLDPGERRRRQAWADVREARYAEHSHPRSAVVSGSLHPAGWEHPTLAGIFDPAPEPAGSEGAPRQGLPGEPRTEDDDHA